MEQQMIDHIVKAGRPIPGESLTNDPTAPQPFEKAPEFTELRDAIEFIFATIIEEDTYIPLMEQIDSGLPVMDFVQIYLFEGFQNGKWNPDLMMLLAEPMTYMIMALAERLDIDYKIYNGEDEEEEAEEAALGTESSKRVLEKIKTVRKDSKIPVGMLPAEMMEEINALPTDSLMAAPEEKPMTESLMAAPAKEEEV